MSRKFTSLYLSLCMTKKNALSKELEAQIFDLEKTLDKRALLQDDNLPKSISELRDRVIYVHRIAEQAVFYHSINIVLERSTKDSNYSNNTFLAWADLIGDLANYLSSLRSFRAQYEFSKYLKALPPELLSKIWRLNEVRNRLVHTKDGKWEMYLDKNNCLGVLKLCCDILEELDGVEAWLDKVEREILQDKK